MYYLVIDVETTGLTSKDEVIQFCGILLNDDLTKCKDFFDFYCMSTVKITDEAYNVHHINLDLLRKLSGDKFFEEYFYKVKKRIPQDCIVIQYGSGFDTRMINQTLEHARLPKYDFGKTVASLKGVSGVVNLNLMAYASKVFGSGRYLKLQNAMKRIDGYDSRQFEDMYHTFNANLKKSGVPDPGNTILAHNARYDAFCTWYLARYLLKRYGLQ